MTRPGLRKRKSPIHTGQISRRELTSMNIASKPVLALTSLARAVAIAACGSSSKPRVSASSGGGGPEAQLLRYSECMRAHAVTGFPHPSTTRSGSNGFGIDGYNFNLPSNMNTQSPAYESAASLCGKQIGLAPAAAAATGSRRPPSWRPQAGRVHAQRRCAQLPRPHVLQRRRQPEHRPRLRRKHPNPQRSSKPRRTAEAADSPHTAHATGRARRAKRPQRH